jgi:hypothetical protein
MQFAEEIILGSCLVVSIVKSGEGGGGAFPSFPPVMLEVLMGNFTGDTVGGVEGSCGLKNSQELSGEGVDTWWGFVSAGKDLAGRCCGAEKAEVAEEGFRHGWGVLC